MLMPTLLALLGLLLFAVIARTLVFGMSYLNMAMDLMLLSGFFFFSTFEHDFVVGLG